MAHKERKSADVQQEMIRLQEQVAHLEARCSLLSRVFDTIPDIIGIQDAQHGVLEYNRAGYTFLGLDCMEIEGKKCFQLVGRDSPCEICATSIAYRTKKMARVERYEESLRIWLDIRAYPVLDDAGNITHVIEHLRDISDEKTFRLALVESEQRYRELVEGTENPVLLTDTCGNILYSNHWAHSMLDLDRGDVSTNFFALVIAEDREQAQYAFKEWDWVGQGALSLENRVLDRAGGVHHILWSISPRDLQSAEQATFTWIGKDVTARRKSQQERERLEAQLRQSQKMEAIGRLAGGIAHDFNNILTGILGYTDLVLTSLESDSVLRKDLSTIREAAVRASNLTMQLLAFSRKQVVVPRLINLNQVIKSYQKMLTRIIGEDVTLVSRPARDLWPIFADPGQMDQVLVNLAVNARDSMPRGGTLTITTENIFLDEDFCRTRTSVETGEYVLLVVEDTGQGMSEEVMERIFEPFFSTKETGNGIGLGLSTVYGIVKQCGGYIEVDSKKGEGSCFRIYFPRSEGREASEQAVREGVVPGGRESILFVEDENLVRDLGKRILESKGYSVFTAANGQDALKLVRESNISVDLLLVDVIMPGMSGPALAEQVLALRPSLKVLFVSGYSEQVIAKYGILNSDVAFITKPFTVESLAGAVRRELDE